MITVGQIFAVPDGGGMITVARGEPWRTPLRSDPPPSKTHGGSTVAARHPAPAAHAGQTYLYVRRRRRRGEKNRTDHLSQKCLKPCPPP